MKKNIIIIVIVIAVVLGGAITAWMLLRSTPPDYNPNYADAIEMRKPEMCENINYALWSGPTDAIIRRYGSEAVELCEQQAKTGFIGCECNEKSLLNDMRKRW